MSLKSDLANGKTVLGGWISLGHAAIGEIFARAGCDWVTIDLEHSVIDMAEAQDLIRAIENGGSTPLVRLSSIDQVQMKRVMDAGAHGVIAPNVKNRVDAEALVQGLYYPPYGTRGVGLARAQGYGTKFKDYMTWLSANAVAVAQIEHIDAIGNLKAILTTPRLDGLLIGPYDLSASMGLAGDFEHPEFIRAMAEIRRVAAQVGMPAGIHVVEPNREALRSAKLEGYRMIAYSVDIRILDCAMRAAFTLD